MNKFIALTALALTVTAGSAFAGDRALVQSYAGGADISALSDAEVNTLVSLIHSGDSEGDKRAVVQNYVD